MTTQRRWLRLGTLAAVILSLLSTPMAAQTDGITPTIVHVVAEPLDDRLRVTAFFSLRDERGRPVLQGSDLGVSLDAAGTVSLLAPRGPDAAGVVGPPQTPLNLLLLIDTSGSMAVAAQTNTSERRIILDEVKLAAVQALEAAPQGARIAVGRFDDLEPDKPLNLMQAITADLQQAAGAITAIPDPTKGAPTCMFNASYQGVEYLRSAVTRPEERRAILLFTDGKDERANGSACSTRNPEDVVAHARTNHTALYTIGLCADSRCTNIEQATLRLLADETAAVATAGTLDTIDDLFGLIMDELNNQWAIQADLYPRQGVNTALLQVNANGRLFSQEFTFTSDRDYNAPPTFELRPTYDFTNDRFTLQVDVTNAQSLEAATLEIWDSDGGVLVRSLPIAGPGTIEVTPEGMLANRKYLFRIRASVTGGLPLLGPEQSPYVIERQVTYEPRLAFTIEGASADWDNDRLLIDLRVHGAGGSKPIFDGQVTNERGEVLIPISAVGLNEAGRMEIVLPDRLQQAQGEQKLKVRLQLITDAEPVEGAYDFVIVPPKRDPPWGYLLAGGLMAILLVYVLLLRRRAPAGGGLAPPPLAVPHSNPSGEIPAAPGAPRLRIRVVSSPDQHEVRAEVITRFPCIVGAGVGAGFLVRGDPTVSRTHLQITHNPQTGFEITDISRHGTYKVEGTRLDPLKPRTPIALRGPVQLSLAKKIVLDIEPL